MPEGVLHSKSLETTGLSLLIMLNKNPDSFQTKHATSLTMQSVGIGPY